MVERCIISTTAYTHITNSLSIRMDFYLGTHQDRMQEAQPVPTVKNIKTATAHPDFLIGTLGRDTHWFLERGFPMGM